MGEGRECELTSGETSIVEAVGLRSPPSKWRKQNSKSPPLQTGRFERGRKGYPITASLQASPLIAGANRLDPILGHELDRPGQRIGNPRHKHGDVTALESFDEERDLPRILNPCENHLMTIGRPPRWSARF